MTNPLGNQISLLIPILRYCILYKIFIPRKSNEDQISQKTRLGYKGLYNHFNQIDLDQILLTKLVSYLWGPLLVGPTKMTKVNPLKFLLFFLTNFYSFWPTWRNPFLDHFSTRVKKFSWGSNCRILKLPCWTSTSKNYSSSFHGI
jgi:hypothetical protein